MRYVSEIHKAVSVDRFSENSRSETSVPYRQAYNQRISAYQIQRSCASCSSHGFRSTLHKYQIKYYDALERRIRSLSSKKKQKTTSIETKYERRKSIYKATVYFRSHSNYIDDIKAIFGDFFLNTKKTFWLQRDLLRQPLIE